MTSLSFLGFAKESSSLPIYGHCQDKSLEESIKGEVGKVDFI